MFLLLFRYPKKSQFGTPVLIRGSQGLIITLEDIYRVPRMILGLMDRRSKGVRCIAMRVFSRVKEGMRLLMWYVCLPRWVVISIYREYRAVMTMLVPMRIIDI